MLLFCFQQSSGQIYVDNNKVPISEDGKTWASAFTQMSEALKLAKADDTIYVAQGTYFSSDTFKTKYFLFIDKNISVIGSFCYPSYEQDVSNCRTVFSGDNLQNDIPYDFSSNRKDNVNHIAIINNPDGYAYFEGIDFSNGNTLYEKSNEKIPESKTRGGGILTNTNLTLNYCGFYQNSGQRGASLFFHPPLSNLDNKLLVSNCTFQDNFSEYGNVRVSSSTESSFTNTVFANNFATKEGGAMTIGNTNCDIKECTFTGNLAGRNGGALYIFQNGYSKLSNEQINIEDCVFSDNLSFFQGGAVKIINQKEKCNYAISKTIFNFNKADGDNSAGGAIYVLNRGSQVSMGPTYCDIDLKAVEIQNNAADLGSGIAMNILKDSINLNITDAIFEKNHSQSKYGAITIIPNALSHCNLYVSHSQFLENTSSFCGAAICLVNQNQEKRIHYIIEHSDFIGNQADKCAGAIWSTITNPWHKGAVGQINHCTFMHNEAAYTSGAINSFGEDLYIYGSTFNQNNTTSYFDDLPGGGAIGIRNPNAFRIKNTGFTENYANKNGSAVLIKGGNLSVFENCVFHKNEGSSAISSMDSLSLINCTLVENEIGLDFDGTYFLTQNTIYSNNLTSFINTSDIASFNSRGGNIVSDTSRQNYFTGYGKFLDYTDTDPNIDNNFRPNQGSICVDAGNPEGILFDKDLYNNERIQGSNIDIGAVESTFTNVFESIINQSIRIAPNPSQDIIEIHSDNNIQIIEILNAKGQFIESITGKSIVDISNLSPGIYFLNIYSDKRTSVQEKFVKI